MSISKTVYVPVKPWSNSPGANAALQHPLYYSPHTGGTCWAQWVGQRVTRRVRQRVAQRVAWRVEKGVSHRVGQRVEPGVSRLAG